MTEPSNGTPPPEEKEEEVSTSSPPDTRRPSLQPTQPRPATRLNRAVLVAAIAIAVVTVWVGAFVLSRPRPAREAERPAPSTTRPLDLDRLTRRQPAPPREMSRELPIPPPPPSRPSVARSGPDPAAQRALRALESPPMVAAFRNPSIYRATSPLETVDEPTAGSRPAEWRPTQEESPSEDPGLSQRKEAFLAEARAHRRSPALPVEVEPALSPFTLIEGTLLPATLVAGISSDLPGQTTALVRAPVFDSATGRHLLIPRGARLLGSYDHRIAWGQKRVLLAWQRIVFPDGSSLDLRGMPGADLSGMAGVRDRVNNHFVRTFGSAILLSAISAGAQLSQPQESAAFGEAASARQVVSAALGQEINRTASLLLRKNLSVAPTLTIRPGHAFTIQLTADLVFSKPYGGSPP